MRTGENIRLRKDGRYEARYPKERDEQGRIVYGCCYGKTYEEAKAKRDAALRPPMREMKLLILGAGEYGVEVRELAESLRIFRAIAFLDDDPSRAGVIGPCAALERYVQEYPIAIAAVGSRALRMRWLSELGRAGFVLPTLIHPTAVVSPSARLGYGTIVEARAIVAQGAAVGNGCIISSGATIDRNVTIPDGAYIDCGRVITPDMIWKEGLA